MATGVGGIRERVHAASARIARVKRADRLATLAITLGALFIIASVSFIFLFILGETWPLFQRSSARALGEVPLAGVPAAPEDGLPAPRSGADTLVLGTDEYQLYLYELRSDGRLAFFRMRDGSLARTQLIASAPPARGHSGATLVSGSRSLTGDHVGAGTADGRAILSQVRFRPRYEEQKLADLEIDVRPRGAYQLDPAARPLRLLAYQEHEGRKAVAAAAGDGELRLLLVGEDETERLHELRIEAGERVTQLALSRTDGLVAATDRGRLYYWELGDEVRLANRTPVTDAPITALALNYGGISALVGDERGRVWALSRVRLQDEDTELALVRLHGFEAHAAAVTAIAPSTRDKSFVTAGADGSLVLRHMTSERTLFDLRAAGPPARVLLAPKMDGLLVQLASGQVARYAVDNAHPEFSFGALFGKVWYEGYAGPEYVWQSTGATDDFEPKFSLVPLVFGTIKGTLYALLFAVPIAVMGALYTSQFMHASLKARVKPLVEIMAALPSVVIGFIAGLWLAARVEAAVVPVLLMVVLLPLFGTAGVFAWERLPRGLARSLRPGMEIFVIVPLLVLGAFATLKLGPTVEGALFGGDFKLWLSQALGLVYDQRNALVVGLAMGFAVIPIIFTIAEDSFSSVPSHLTAASLALGASRWQTATRVVLPTASPGIFSAVMIGFGRAVGETMIVLMATGNTPVLDWSIFNGMRTLSANIAVEVPEAPHGGTLYRILFLAAGVLFLMTFVINTVAEVIRQRLRERYKAI